MLNVCSSFPWKTCKLDPSHPKISEMRSAASLLLFDDLWSQVEVRATNGGGPGTHRTPEDPRYPSCWQPEISGEEPSCFFKKWTNWLGIWTVDDVDISLGKWGSNGFGSSGKNVDMYTKNVRSSGGHRPWSSSLWPANYRETEALNPGNGVFNLGT